MASSDNAFEPPRHVRPGRAPRRTWRAVLAVAVLATGGGVAFVVIHRSSGPSEPGVSKPAVSVTPEVGLPSQSASPARGPAPALWQRTPAPAAPLLVSLPGLRPGVDVPTTAGLSRVVTPLLADPALAGEAMAIVVSDAATGQVLLNRGGADAVAPASTAKLAVAVAALEVLGADHRLTTEVVQGDDPSEVVLVGGGDPTLAGPKAVGVFGPGYPAPAKLTDLASQTASRLRAAAIATVSVGYDARMFTGPATATGWKPTYVTEGDVAPVSALEVDEGRSDLARPARTADPAAAAAIQFAALLTADGLTVTGKPRPTRAVSGHVTLALVQSPPVSALVQRMLGSSDNDLAEAMARQVAIAGGGAATFLGGAKAVKAAVTRLGVDPPGVALVDSSGLSPADRVRPAALVQLVRLALGPGHPELAPILAGLPVAGFSGTLLDRFVGTAASAAGLVRAKTGTLDGVVALAGYLEDAGGRILVFAIVAHGVVPTATVKTEAAIDRLAAGLSACGCR
jgi:D-alanyl-D-alanine carboxypeptidase/D-alanyl-D-alanine-endopeptidase (penicillin-binding protein 4)